MENRRIKSKSLHVEMKTLLHKCVNKMEASLLSVQNADLEWNEAKTTLTRYLNQNRVLAQKLYLVYKISKVYGENRYIMSPNDKDLHQMIIDNINHRFRRPKLSISGPASYETQVSSGMSKGKYNYIKKKSSKLNLSIARLYIGKSCRKPEIKNEEMVLRDSLIKRISNKNTNGARYSPEEKVLWIKGYLKNSNCCNYFSKKFNGPARSNITNWIKENKETMVPTIQQLLNVNFIEDIIKLWKLAHKISHDKIIEAGLTIDAMKVDENLLITPSNDIIGLINNEMISKKEIKELVKNQKLLNHKLSEEVESSNVVSYIFCFYLLPIERGYKPLPVHISQSSQGAASDSIINTIDLIWNLFNNCSMNITLRFLSFDGDKKYLSYHRSYLMEWMPKYLTEFKLQNISKAIISDPMHLLKRLRYRLVNHVNLSFGNKNSASISTQTFQKLFPNITDLAWNPSQVTKQDDFYPKLLFNSKNLLKCFSKRRWKHLAFLLPGVILNEVISNANMSNHQAQLALLLGVEFMSIILSYYYNYSSKEKVKVNLEQQLSLITNEKFRFSNQITFKGTTLQRMEKIRKNIVQEEENLKKTVSKAGPVGKRLSKILIAQSNDRKPIPTRSSPRLAEKSALITKRSKSIEKKADKPIVNSAKRSKSTKSSKKEKTLSKYPSATPFDRDLILEILNTLHSLSLFLSENHECSMAIYGSMLLENYYGRIRVHSYFDHCLDRILDIIVKLMLVDFISDKNEEDKVEKIHCRNFNFTNRKQCIINAEDSNTVRDIAKYLIAKSCPEIFDSHTRKNILTRNKENIERNMSYIFSIEENVSPRKITLSHNKRRIYASNRKGHFSHSNNRSISSRFMSSPIRSLKKDPQKIIAYYDKLGKC